MKIQESMTIDEAMKIIKAWKQMFGGNSRIYLDTEYRRIFVVPMSKPIDNE